MSEKLVLAAGGIATVRAGNAPSQPTKPPMFTCNCYNGGLMSPVSPMLDAPVLLDLASTSARSQDIPALLDHDDRQIVGQTTFVSVGRGSINAGGRITGDLEDPAEPAAKVWTHAKNGYVWRLSPGGGFNRSMIDFVPLGEVRDINMRSIAGPFYILRGVVINEISFLSIAADDSTRADVGGFEREPAKANSGAGAAAGALANVAAHHQVTAEQVRIRAICDLCVMLAKYKPTDIDYIEMLGKRAVAEGWSKLETEAHFRSAFQLQPI